MYIHKLSKNIVRISVHVKLIYRFNKIPIKIPGGFFLLKLPSGF